MVTRRKKGQTIYITCHVSKAAAIIQRGIRKNKIIFEVRRNLLSVKNL